MSKKINSITSEFKHLYYPIPETPLLGRQDYSQLMIPKSGIREKSISITEAHSHHLYWKFSVAVIGHTNADPVKGATEFFGYYGMINKIHYNYFFVKHPEDIVMLYMDRGAKLTEEYYETFIRWNKNNNRPMMVLILFIDLINGQPVFEEVPKTGAAMLQKEQ